MNLSVGFGMGGLIQSSPDISMGIKIAGLGYILFLAYSLIKSSGSGELLTKLFIFQGHSASVS